MTDQTPHALPSGDDAATRRPACSREVFSDRGALVPPRGNAVTHGAYSLTLVSPRVRELYADRLAAHQHLDEAKDGPALARYCTLLARIERVDAWLAEQPDDVFSDAEAGTIHGAHERLERWMRMAEAAEHRLALDPYTRSKLGLVQVQAFDLAQAMAKADGDA